MVLRNPSPKEFMLLEFLVGEADLSEASEAILESLKVADIDDGGMGSLRLFPKGSDDRTERIGNVPVPVNLQMRMESRLWLH